MDNANNGGYDTRPPGPPVPIPQPAAPRKRTGWRIFWGVVLTLSILANVFLLFVVLAVVSLFVAGSGDVFESRRDGFAEEVLVRGPAYQKIAVIRIEGIIDGVQSERFRKQLRIAANDENVHAVIVRTLTPGGTIAGSDQIHHEITKFRKQTGKPIVAFMQSVAASGGYYTSVACDTIVAEPTVITGSIGVIMNSLVIKELLEDKLGIQPITIKSGPRKDWPSMFTEVTEEQKQYLFDKIISPAYERFVSIVDEGREGLSEQQVRQLADGSIFAAEEARENGLVDEIGYFEDVVRITEQLAGIRDAKVVEYTRLFSLTALFGGMQSGTAGPWQTHRDALHELTMPQLMYLWEGR